MRSARPNGSSPWLPRSISTRYCWPRPTNRQVDWDHPIRSRRCRRIWRNGSRPVPANLPPSRHLTTAAKSGAHDPAAASERDNQCASTRAIVSRKTRSSSCLSGRKSNVENRPGEFAARSPQASAIAFDDRTAYGQAHAHAIGLCRKERVKNAIEVLRIDPRSRVPHRYQYVCWVLERGFYN